MGCQWTPNPEKCLLTKLVNIRNEESKQSKPLSKAVLWGVQIRAILEPGGKQYICLCCLSKHKHKHMSLLFEQIQTRTKNTRKKYIFHTFHFQHSLLWAPSSHYCLSAQGNFKVFSILFYTRAECDVSVSRLPGLETFAIFLIVSVSVSKNLVSEIKSRFRYRKIWSR